MKIIAENIGKKFHKEWIFRNIQFTSTENEILAITGENGKGKSTLINIISTYIDPTEGTIQFYDENKLITDDEIPKKINIVAPYIHLIEELTLNELFDFHFQFKKNICSKNEILDTIQLSRYSNKYIKDFSSGMKQRVKLGLAFFSHCQLILLDEPTTFLDKKGIEIFFDLLKKKLNINIIISSNLSYEYKQANKIIKL